jgi:hypothetical protein
MKYSPYYAHHLAKQGGVCYYCKQPLTLENATVDHFLPKKDGHKLPGNRVLCCEPCNGTKKRHTIESLRVKLIDNICRTLRDIINQNWKVDDVQLKRLKRWTAMLKTTKEIMDNDYKPLYIF